MKLFALFAAALLLVVGVSATISGPMTASPATDTYTDSDSESAFGGRGSGRARGFDAMQLAPDAELVLILEVSTSHGHLKVLFLIELTPDASGNVRLVTYYDTAIRIEGKYRYKPFGERIDLVPEVRDPVLRFAQQPYDAGIGQYHMGARNYDQSIGRFRSRDPIGPGYEYGANNPLSYADPSGLAPTRIYYGGPGGAGGWVCTECDYTSPLQGLFDWWDSLPPEWKFVIQVLAAVAIIAITVATAGTALPFILAGGIAGAAIMGVNAWLKGGSPEDIIFAAVDGFLLGSAIVSVELIAAKGLIAIGKALAKAWERVRTWAGEFAVNSVSGTRPFLRVPSAAKGTLTPGASAKLPKLGQWENPATLADHFTRHGARVGVSSEAAYVNEAGQLLSRASRGEALAKLDGQFIRVYDPSRDLFGSYSVSGGARTFYVPDPAIHGYPSNMAYWNAQPGVPWP